MKMIFQRKIMIMEKNKKNIQLSVEPLKELQHDKATKCAPNKDSDHADSELSSCIILDNIICWPHRLLCWIYRAPTQIHVVLICTCFFC